MDAFGGQTENQVPWKKIAIIGGIGVGVIVIIVIAVIAVRNWQAEQAAFVRTTEQVEEVVANCDRAPDPEACRADKIAEAAQTTGASDVCDMLGGTDRDDCLWEFARAQGDAAACAGIADAADRVLCTDGELTKQALASGNPDDCNGISDAEKKDNCRSTLLRQEASAGDCDTEALGQTYCADIQLLEAAVAARNPAGCEDIQTQSLRDECVDGVGPGDVDRDGLNATLESRYGTSDDDADSDDDGLSDFAEVNEWGTDPINPDTDGDSFSDGTEAAGGYNPLGAGTLESEEEE